MHILDVSHKYLPLLQQEVSGKEISTDETADQAMSLSMAGGLANVQNKNIVIC